MRKSHEIQSLCNVLIICDEGVDHAILSRLFVNSGFSLTVTRSMVTADDLDNYGAIIHIGHSEDLLEKRLGDRLADIKDEEWIFLAGGNTSDLHCTIEVTKSASQSLRNFIRLLWSRFSIP